MPRLQMDINPESKARLDKIKATAEATSYTEVIKNALRLYEFILDEDRNGTEFYIKKEGKDISALKFFLS